MTSVADNPVSGLKILLVEDEFLIALDAEQMLAELDVGHVKIVGSYDRALEAVEHDVFDVAILDVNLDGKLSFALGAVLSRRGLPYLFASGYNLSERSEFGVTGAVCIAKPYDKDQLRKGVALALKKRTPDG